MRLYWIVCTRVRPRVRTSRGICGSIRGISGWSRLLWVGRRLEKVGYLWLFSMGYQRERGYSMSSVTVD